MDVFAFEVARLALVDAIWLFRVELTEPEIAMRCLETIIALDRLYDSNVQAVALLAMAQLPNVA